MKRNRLRALLVLPCILGACGAPRIAGVPVEDPVLVAGLRKRVEAPYPASFRAQHRVTLTFRGKQFDFTGYLLVRRPGTWRAMAFGEFGGSLFDIAAFPGRGLRIIKNPGAIRERWLTGPAADIIKILYLPPEGEPVSVSKTPSSIVLAYFRGTGALEFGFPGGESGLAESRFSVSRGGAVYDIVYSDYAEFAGLEQKVPRHIVVENKRMQLRLDMDLIKFEPMEIPENYFAI
ncbi:MAG TPA: hypothetical protein DCL44_02680 [Elusimicrobia bacterium]|nr:hypothetical protein [Elusimicrobiota bacterium]